MRYANFTFILFLVILLFIYDFVNYDFVNLFKFSFNGYVCSPKLELPKLNAISDIVVLIATSILIIYLLFILLLYYSNTIRYVRFSNNISTLNKKSLVNIEFSTIVFTHLLLCPIFINFESIVLLIIQFDIDIFYVNISLKLCYKLLILVYKTYVFSLKISFKIIHYNTIILFKKSLYSW